MAGRFFTTVPPGKPSNKLIIHQSQTLETIFPPYSLFLPSKVPSLLVTLKAPTFLSFNHLFMLFPWPPERPTHFPSTFITRNPPSKTHCNAATSMKSFLIPCLQSQIWVSLHLRLHPILFLYHNTYRNFIILNVSKVGQPCFSISSPILHNISEGPCTKWRFLSSLDTEEAEADGGLGQL